MHHQQDPQSRSLGYVKISSLIISYSIWYHLLGEVKQWNKPFLNANVGDNLPLVPSEIQSGRIVCAAMQHHHVAHCSPRPKGLSHTLKIDRKRVRVKVRVSLTLYAIVDEGPYLLVVDPRRI